MQKKILARIGSFTGILLFILSVVIISHELQGYHYTDIVRSIARIPFLNVTAAAVFTLFNYAVMGGYEYGALRYTGTRLPVRKISFVSFIGYSFSNSMGYSYLSGGAVRYRLYSLWGIRSSDISRIILFSIVAIWLGYAVVSGIFFVAHPLALPEQVHLPFISTVPLGFLLLAAVGAYLLATRLGPDIGLPRRRKFVLPSSSLSFVQIGIASLYWFVSGLVLYTLMTGTVSIVFVDFMVFYLLAQLLGNASQVPAGLGIFEAVFLTLLPHSLNRSGVLGGIVAFRVLYYFLPLLAASGLLGAYELIQRKKLLGRVLFRSRR